MDGGDDEDPEMITIGQVYDLAIVKEIVGAGPFAPGDTVAFEITVFNQGSLNASNIEVTDILPSNLTLSGSDTNGWNGPSTGPVTNTVSSLIGGADTTILIDVIIDPNFQGSSLSNNVMITADDGDDIDSDPSVIDALDDYADNDDPSETDGGDDEDPEELPVTQTYDLAIIKETVSTGPFAQGDTVTFSITVYNQGTLDASNVEVTDMLPTGLTLITSDANGWTSVSTSMATNMVSSLVAGADTTINIDVVIDPSFQGTSLSNNAMITADDGDDVDSDPSVTDALDDYADNNDPSETDGGDDEDPEQIMIDQVYDLALIKEITTQGPYSPGQDITYTITVCNQGSLDANTFEVTDHIPTGMTLSTTAGTNAGWTGPAAGPVTYTHTGLLAAADPDNCEAIAIVPVSYTHLTLPTICSV